MADALFDIASGDDNAVQVYPVEPVNRPLILRPFNVTFTDCVLAPGGRSSVNACVPDKVCRFSFTCRKRASMGSFIPLPVENSFTCRIPVRRLRAGSMLQFSG